MNRRTFFQRTVGAVVTLLTVRVRPAISRAAVMTVDPYCPVTNMWFLPKDILVLGEDAITGRKTGGTFINDEIYFMGTDGPYVLTPNKPPNRMWQA